jgi:hypothetical protein
MNVDAHKNWALYAVPDTMDDEGFAAESREQPVDVFKSEWLAGGLSDRLAA